MADTPFLQLSDNWRLASDPLQWIIQRREGKQWRSVQFIASTREVLVRCLRELGAVVDKEAQLELDNLPGTFREWKKTPSAPRRRNKTPSNAIQGDTLTDSREAA